MQSYRTLGSFVSHTQNWLSYFFFIEQYSGHASNTVCGGLSPPLSSAVSFPMVQVSPLFQRTLFSQPCIQPHSFPSQPELLEELALTALPCFLFTPQSLWFGFCPSPA